MVFPHLQRNQMIGNTEGNRSERGELQNSKSKGKRKGWRVHQEGEQRTWKKVCVLIISNQIVSHAYSKTFQQVPWWGKVM